MAIMIDSGDDDPLEALASMLGGKKRKSRTPPSTKPPMREAVISTLKELAAAYGNNPFKVGDLVTPRPGLNLRDAGALHVVVHVETDPHHHFRLGGETSESTHSIGYGRYLDVRVLSFCHGGGEWAFVPFWMESWQLQPYNPDEDPYYK